MKVVSGIDNSTQPQSPYPFQRQTGRRLCGEEKNAIKDVTSLYKNW